MKSPVIILNDAPIPPQSNNMFENRIIRTRKGPRMGRMKSKKYLAYEIAFDEWAEDRDGAIEAASELCKEMIRDQKTLIKVDMLIAVPWSSTGADKSAISMWARAKSNRVPATLRIWDASNRIKAAHDLLSKALDVGDHYFTTGLAEKVLVDDDGPSFITFRLTFHPVRTWSEAFNELNSSEHK